MQTKDFYFDLPEELIAQFPSPIRGQDKLMVLDRKNGVFHRMMDDLPDLIEPGTLMVFNNSKVRRSRCFARKEGADDGAKLIEFFFLQEETDISKQSGVSCWKTMVKNAKRQKPGSIYEFPDGTRACILDIEQDKGTEFKTIQFFTTIDESWFEKNGHIPLPPYIKRADNEDDSQRYQNVYAAETGSTACPTAGLHFTPEMMARLEKRGIEICYVTLHVGLGTFLPVRAVNIEEHVMHEEVYSISSSTACKITEAKRNGRTVLAVGTTSVRTIESAWNEDGKYIKEGAGKTSIFMYPGYTFKAADRLFTNFHTPESTLLMLVSAFAGREKILDAYKQAVRDKYRFFSYGDAMLIM